MFKDFFYFTRGERGGIYVLCSLIILMFSINFCLPTRSTEEEKMLSYLSNQKTDSVSSDTTNRHVYSDLSTTNSTSPTTPKQRKHSSTPTPVNNQPYTNNYTKKKIFLLIRHGTGGAEQRRHHRTETTERNRQCIISSHCKVSEQTRRILLS